MQQKHKIISGSIRWAKAVGNQFLDLLYPRRCPLCEKILSGTDGRICPDCKKKLPYIKEPVCKKCGKPLRRQEQEYCENCEKADHRFRWGRCIFLYEKEFRSSVGRMKFSNRREYLDFYAEEMAKRGGGYLKQWKPAVLIPVPMHPRKRRQRGFDQSRLLAEKLGKLTGIPVDHESLARVRYTLPQKDLDARERRANLKDAFAVKPGAHIPEPVVLIDDIYTTGATLDAITRTLNRSGIFEIYFLALCTGRSGS